MSERTLPECTCVPNGLDCEAEACDCPLHYLTRSEYEQAMRVRAGNTALDNGGTMDTSTAATKPQ